LGTGLHEGRFCIRIVRFIMSVDKNAIVTIIVTDEIEV